MKWYAFHAGGNNIYAARHGRDNSGKRTTELLHRLIANAHTALHIDHINGNGLDNRKSNLRLANHQQNAWNAIKRDQRGSTLSTSKFIGVSFCKKSKKWTARITYNGKNLYLGTFEKEIDAAIQWDRMARELRGEYTRINVQGVGYR